MQIIPAIDLIEGKCVRLTEGDFDRKTVYNSDPVKQALEFKALGAKRIHIVDLDGAKTGNSVNREVIKKIKKECGLEVQTGGGIRSLADVEELVEAGIDYVILGTMLVENYEESLKIVERYADKVIAGIDVKDNMVKTRGWKDGEGIDKLEFGKKLFQDGFKSTVFTDISKDGKLQGPNIDATEEMCGTGLKVILSGGISSIDDIRQAATLKYFGLSGIIVGKAYYEGKVDLKEAFIEFASPS